MSSKFKWQWVDYTTKLAPLLAMLARVKLQGDWQLPTKEADMSDKARKLMNEANRETRGSIYWGLQKSSVDRLTIDPDHRQFFHGKKHNYSPTAAAYAYFELCAIFDQLKADYPQLEEHALTEALLAAKEDELKTQFKKNSRQSPLVHLFVWSDNHIQILNKTDGETTAYIQIAARLERYTQLPGDESDMSENAKKLMYDAKEQFDKDCRSGAFCYSEHIANNQFFSISPNEAGKLVSFPSDASFAYFEMRAMIDALTTNYPRLKEPFLTEELLRAKEDELRDELSRDPNRLPLKDLFVQKYYNWIKSDRQAEAYIKTAAELQWLIRAFGPIRYPQLPVREEEMSEKAKELMNEAKEQFRKDYEDATLSCSEHIANNQFFSVGPNNAGQEVFSPCGAACAYFEMCVMIDELRIKWNPPILTDRSLTASEHELMEEWKRDPNQPPLKYLFALKDDEVVKLDRQTNVYIKIVAELEGFRRALAPRFEK